MQIGHIVGTLLATVGLIAATLASAHALLYKRRPQSAFGWIAVCYTLPLAGALLYYLFGINRVRARAKKLLLDFPEPTCPTEHVGAPPVGFKTLAQLGAGVTGWPLTAGNRVELFHDAEHTFAAMLASIESAQRSVHLCTYIFDAGPVGQRFTAALAAAAERGVAVRVLVDGVGELYSRKRPRTVLRGTRVQVARFLPPRLVPPALSINMRNHRKTLVVDGREAFTGGMNIRDSYLGSDAARRIVDFHAYVAGPVVAQIETTFARDWHFATGEALRGTPELPTSAGSALCRAVADGPDSELDRLTELLIGAIGSARRRVAIMSPYFLPPRELVAALGAAALAGIDVAVILPANNNLPYVHRATRHLLWELIERGVRVYYQPGPFVHTKFFYCDDDYAQIGSANLDARSLRLNFELNLEVYDRPTVAALAAHFQTVRARSTPVTLETVDGRPLVTKLIDGAAWLFSPYL